MRKNLFAKVKAIYYAKKAREQGRNAHTISEKKRVLRPLANEMKTRANKRSQAIQQPRRGPGRVVGRLSIRRTPDRILRCESDSRRRGTSTADFL